MKNKILLLLLFVHLGTGCTNINNKDYKSLVDIALKQKSTTNVASNGYNLFVPRGMTLINDNSNNITLYSDGKKYYMYVDLVSYYNKNDSNYTEADNTIYSEVFNENDKKLYVSIKKVGDGRCLVVQYNYAKIEVVTDDVEKDLIKSIIVLNNIRYNDIVINSLIGNSSFDYNEEQYNLKSPKEKKADNSQFLQYKEDYGNYEDSNIKDEDLVDVKD